MRAYLNHRMSGVPETHYVRSICLVGCLAYVNRTVPRVSELHDAWLPRMHDADRGRLNYIHCLLNYYR